MREQKFKSLDVTKLFTMLPPVENSMQPHEFEKAKTTPGQH